MANQSHPRALIFGLVVGGIAGAAHAVWHAKQSGRDLRASLRSTLEEASLDLLGVDELTLSGAGATPVGVPADVKVAEAPAMPPVDIVLDGPRAASAPAT